MNRLNPCEQYKRVLYEQIITMVGCSTGADEFSCCNADDLKDWTLYISL